MQSHGRLLRLGIALVILAALSLIASVALIWQQDARQDRLEVFAAQRPATVSVLSSQNITTTGQTGAFGTAYYREAVGYISTTVTAGTITYTWQSSPDGSIWFDQMAISAVSESGRVTSTLSYFGPRMRLSYVAGEAADVTTSAWLALKE